MQFSPLASSEDFMGRGGLRFSLSFIVSELWRHQWRHNDVISTCAKVVVERCGLHLRPWTIVVWPLVFVFILALYRSTVYCLCINFAGCTTRIGWNYWRMFSLLQLISWGIYRKVFPTCFHRFGCNVGSRPSDHYFRSVCLFVCAEFFSAVFDPISIKLGHMLYVWVWLCPLEYRGCATPGGWVTPKNLYF